MNDRFFDDPELAVHYEQFRPNYFGVGLEKEVASFIKRTENSSNVKDKETLALDIGCGSGQLTRVLAPLFTKMVGIDCSEAQIKVAREVTKEENIEYMTGIAEDLSFFKDNSVDFISTAAAMHYFTPELFLAEVRRVLRPGGSVLFITPSKKCFTLKALTDNDEVNDKVMEVMREVYNAALTPMSRNARQSVNDGNYSVPDFPDNHQFQLTVQRRYDDIEEVVGFLKSSGALREQMKGAPEKGDPYEQFKKGFLSVLPADSSPTPEQTPFVLTLMFTCDLYRKPL